jgi:hypothetical protein
LGFSPSLLLLPSSPVSGDAWSAPAQIESASGGWSRSVATTYAGLSTPDSRVAAEQNLSPGSTVVAMGAIAPGASLSTGEPVLPTSVALSGQFRLLDGIDLDALGASLFAPPAGPVAIVTGISENSSALDYDPTVVAHLGITSSVLRFAPAVAPPTGAAAAPPGVAVLDFEPPGWAVQALPESASSAEASFTSWGLVPSVQAPANPATLSNAGGIPIAILLGVAALVGIAVAIGVRWRSAPETVAPGGNGQIRPQRIEEPEPRSPTTPAMPADPIATPPRDPFDDLL